MNLVEKVWDCSCANVHICTTRLLAVVRTVTLLILIRVGARCVYCCVSQKASRLQTANDLFEVTLKVTGWLSTQRNSVLIR